MSAFWVALGFLTTLPVLRHDLPADALRRAGVWFPVVGLLLGALLAAAAVGLRLVLPAPVAAVLVTVIWVALTGGLHLDGLADCCDGFFAPVDRTRRGEIMRDPRVGTFGALGLLLALLLKLAALLATPTPIAALLVTPMWARWLILPAARGPQAHPGGMGSSFAAGLTPTTLLVALIVPVATTLLVAGLTGRFVTLSLVVDAGHLVGLGVVRLAQHKLGGVTGDVLGLVVEAGEVAMLLAFAVRL